MDNILWSQTFKKLYDKAVQQYRDGQRDSATYFDAEELSFLASIGHSAQEIYDFAEDFVGRNEPDYEAALLVAAVRRDYFLVVMEGKASEKRVTPAELTGKQEAEAGIAWLPRIIEKAEAKLRGEMDADLMYGCGGDRKFFKDNNVHAADFLRNVWAADGDRSKIIDYVKACRAEVDSSPDPTDGNGHQWTVSFRDVFEKAVQLYQQGQRGSETYFSESETAFLASIGHSAQEVYDFAEDHVEEEVPDYETIVLIAAVRRDYFLVEMKGATSEHIVKPADLPGKEEEAGDIVWLPRIIAKANAKLRGEMDADIMFSCGGDRKFLRTNNVHAADFLRHIWAADGDRQQIIDYVKKCRAEV